ncbi:MAG: peptide chain release factor 2 [Bacillota bacterium]|nr:peptide chain release factor 2 [Bacillota bacterium]MDW7682940.1 peptide chain release factor 2 [Bacillota bacterium]
MASEIKTAYKELHERLTEMSVSLDVAVKNEQIAKLEAVTGEPEFWSDQESAQKTIQELSALRDDVNPIEAIREKLADLEVIIALAEEDDDSELWADAEKSVETLRADLDRLELVLLFRGRYDGHSAIVSIHPGAGGTESQDWAAMLLRMYTRWAERKNYQVETLDLLPGDEAGIKSATLLIKGKNAYGYMKAERGVHRLVRISPFDAAKRRHTSFASLDVLPEIEDDEQDIDIKPEDLKIDTYRASGAGGQHVNTTDSAVRITHLPTGVVVQCQNERSQHANRDRAMKILRGRLADLMQRQQAEEISSLRGEQKEIAWGSQIRSYVFQPYTLVKDHRTGVEVGNINAVMDGDLNELVESYLRQTAGENKQ